MKRTILGENAFIFLLTSHKLPGHGKQMKNAVEKQRQLF